MALVTVALCALQPPTEIFLYFFLSLAKVFQLKVEFVCIRIPICVMYKYKWKGQKKSKSKVLNSMTLTYIHTHCKCNAETFHFN